MAHGALWSFVERGGQQAASLVIFMVLARLIGPAQYGLANICFIYFLLSTLLISSLVDGVVSLQLKDDLSLSSLFWAIIAVGLLLSLLCFGSASAIASFMGQPVLEKLLHWFAAIPFLMSVSAVPNMLIQQKMNYKVYAMRTLGATLAGGVVGLIMAFKGCGAFAIVGQQITLNLVINAIVWFSIDWRPSWRLSLSALRSTVRPGVGTLGINMMLFGDEQAPRLMIGKWGGADDLGFYALATRLRNAIQEIFVVPPLIVQFPAFASIQNDKSEQERLTGRILLMSFSVVLPMLALIIVTAPIFVPLLFGSEWAAAVRLIQILFLGTAAAPLTLAVRHIFQAHGQLAKYFRIKVAASLCGVASMFLLLLPNGLVWFAWATVGIAFLTQPVNLYFLKRALGIELGRVMWPLIKPASIALLVAAVTHGVNRASESSGGLWWRLGINLAIGCSFCAASYLVLMRHEIVSLVRQVKALRQTTAS